MSGDVTRAVRAGEELDLERLKSYLESVVGRLPGPLEVQRFPAGHSNLTYLVTGGDRPWVLRRPPVGPIARGAHDVVREARILERLAPVYPAAPTPVAICEDEAVLGAPFYLMERRTGLILRREPPAGLTLDPGAARALSETFVAELARLHAVDYAAAGLAELGNPAGYVERQVSGWTRRYAAARTHDLAEMGQVGEWLFANLPRETGAALIHNDFKYDNLILDLEPFPCVVGVLDWEMATIGDPLMDLGTALAYWVEADDEPALQAVRFGPTQVPGSFTRVELARRYGELTGRDVSNVAFYHAFGLFKTAVVGQQLYFRFQQGQTRDERFEALPQAVAALARLAVGVLAGRDAGQAP